MNLKNFPKRLDSKTSSLRISVPENLDLALEGLIRKVLREQPKTDDIYSFAANYFETLLEIREKTGAKFTAGQLCPFHNDEDAHEMIKLAGTFSKPARKMGKPKESEGKTEGKNDVRRSKAKESSKYKKPVVNSKQATPDLIKKLPKLIKNQPEEEIKKKKDEKLEKKVEGEEEEEEFLLSDPIKELVDKEIMMEGDSRKNETERREKTERENTQEEKRLEEKAAKESVEKESERKEEERKQENSEKSDQIPEKEDKTKEEGTEVVKNENKESTEHLEVTSTENKKDKEEESKNEVETTAEEKDKSPNEGEDTNTKEKGIHESSKIKQSESKPEIEKEDKKSDEMNERHNATADSETTTKVTETDKLTQFLGEEMSKSEQNHDTNDILINSEHEEITNGKTSEESTEKIPEAKIKEIENDQQTNKTKNDFDIPIKVPENIKEEIPSMDTQDIGNNNVKEVEDQNKETEEGKPRNETSEVLEVKKAEIDTKDLPKGEKIEEIKPQTMENQEGTQEAKTILMESEKEINLEPLEQLEERSNQESKDADKTGEEVKDESKLLDEKLIVKEEQTETKDDKEGGEAEKPYNEIRKEDGEKDENPSEPENVTNQREEPLKEGQITLEPSSDKGEKLEAESKMEIAGSQVNVNSSLEHEQKILEEKNFPVKEETKETEGKLEVENSSPDSQRQEKTTESTSIPNESEKEETSAEAEEPMPEEELCTVVDIQHLPKENENHKMAEVKNLQPDVSEPETPQMEIETEKSELTSSKEEEVESEELCRVVDIHHLSKREETTDDKPETENIQKKEEETEAEELCSVVDIDNLSKDEEKTNKSERTKSAEDKVEAELSSADPSHSPAEGKGGDEEPSETEEPEKEERKPESSTSANPEHIITVEEPEVSPPSSEIQIKTIQTHYYDSLQVPETVTKEYRVHSVGTPMTGLLGVGDFLQRGQDAAQELENTKEQPLPVVDENVNSPTATEFLGKNTSPPPDVLPSETTQPVNPESSDTKSAGAPTQEAEEKSESDDILMTPSSGYSLNLSELSYKTISGQFLDSERRYSSFEKEEFRYAPSELKPTVVSPEEEKKTTESGSVEEVIEKTIENRQEVEELIEKTTLISGIEAVPMPPRDIEEINEEGIAETPENKKGEEDKKPEDQPSESSDSSNGRSEESDVPIISVEVKTVIETQVLDDEDEEKDAEHPDVEVKLEARIDIEDGNEKASSSAQTETEIANEKSEYKPKYDSEEIQNKSEEDNRKESTSTNETAGKDGSTGESDSVSSAATEIKRTSSGRMDLSTSRGLSSTQSLDFGKRNPLLKTRSLSTFRHGVTDFEVWNTIEKELEVAATKIQSNFRGYKTRKRLQRENAVQITTEESSSSTTPAEAEPKEGYQESTGEFHDSIILPEHPR